MGPPMWIGAWAISLHAGWATEKHNVTFRTAQAIVLSFHPVTGHLHNSGRHVYGPQSLSVLVVGVTNSRSQDNRMFSSER